MVARTQRRQQAGDQQEGGAAFDPARFANLAQHSEQSDRAELGISGPDAISADNLRQEAQAQAGEGEGAAAQLSSEVRKAQGLMPMASVLVQRPRAHAAWKDVTEEEAAEANESDAASKPSDDFASSGHFMVIPGTS